jgi:hypothetical protein
MLSTITSYLLAFNSFLWFLSLGFLSYGFGMLVAFLDWRIFLFSLVVFLAVSFTEVVLTALIY